MKKFIYSVLAVAALAACAKELDKQSPEKASEDVVGDNLVAITASVEESSKTAYADNKTFSWLAGDLIRVRVSNGSNAGYANFKTTEGGSTATFSASLSDYYRPSGNAVYPANLSPAISGEDFLITLPQQYFYNRGNENDPSKYTYTGDANPLKTVPLIGDLQPDGSYKFKTAMGVAHFKVTDVAEGTSFVALYANENIRGKFKVVDGAVSLENYVSDGGNMAYFVVTPAEDNSVSVYFPLPVGTLSAGFEIRLLDSKGSATLFSQVSKKPITIERNKITEVAPFKGSYSWESIGKGKFYDNFLWTNLGLAANTPVEVEIAKNLTEPGSYKLIDPYGAAATLAGKTVADTRSDFAFKILKAGDKVYNTTTTLDDWVFYDSVESGVADAYSTTYNLNFPGTWTSYAAESSWGRNYVARYQSDGTSPANILVAPIYLYGDDNYWTAKAIDLAHDDIIQIVFPEQELISVNASLSFVEISDDTPAQPIAKASVAFGSAFKQVALVAAADATAAAAAFQDASLVSFAITGGDVEVKLPADAPSGKYAIYASFVPADGMNSMLATTIVSEEFQYDRSDETWTELGTGKYYDDIVAYYCDLTSNKYAEVQILQNPNDANNFRVIDPYGAIATANSYSFSTASSAIARDDYLNLTVNSDGTVYFDAMNTGFYYSSSQFSGYFKITYPTDARDTYPNGKNYVTKYDSDGKPANIYLAPTYLWPPTDYWTGDSYIYDNGIIEIVFPGSAPLDIAAKVAFSEIVDDTPAQAIAKVLVSLGDDLASANLVIAASDAAAASALANSSMVTVATGTGEFDVKLPADAPSGTYYVYAQTVPSDDLAPACADVVVSEGFQYSRADVDLGITADMIVGSYTQTTSIVPTGGSGWVSGNDIPLVVELSNDTNAGDIMFTAIADVDATDDMGVYGVLDGKTGEITVPGNQVFATYDMADEGDPEELWDFALVAWAVTSSGISLAKDDGITFLYDKDAKTLKLTSHKYLGIWCYESGTDTFRYRWNIMNLSNPFTLVTASSGAPAAAPRGWSVRKLSGKDASTFVKLPSVSNK